MRSPYQVLGLKRTATIAEIKSAYRRRAGKLHPDHGGDPAKFREMHTSYRLLIDPERRRLYDSKAQPGVAARRHAPAAPRAYTTPPPSAAEARAAAEQMSSIGLRIVGGFMADLFDGFVPSGHPLEAEMNRAKAERDSALAGLLRQFSTGGKPA